jgi:hypothetical protein
MMMKRLLALGIVTAAVVGGWCVLRGPSENERIFYGRAWIDHAPKDRTDSFRVFGTSNKHPFGWFATRAAWKGEWEAFRYERRGDGRIEVLLPHSQKKLAMTFRAWKCKEHGFELCMELSGDGAPTKYFSMKQWRREDLDAGELDAALAAGAE